MQRKLILGALVALLLALASVPVAFAGGGSGRGGNDDARVIQLTTRVLQEADVDAPPAGPSVGDRFVFSDAVFRDGKRVGTDGGECVLVHFTPGPGGDEEPETFTVQCAATVSLPEGQITAQGLVDFTEEGSFRLAVTGGTGEFRTARGELEVTEESEEVDRLEFKLILHDD